MPAFAAPVSTSRRRSAATSFNACVIAGPAAGTKLAIGGDPAATNTTISSADCRRSSPAA